MCKTDEIPPPEFSEFISPRCRIKEEVEKKESGAWHVIVGVDYGSQCTHEAPGLIALDISLPLVSLA